jgi:hypothetical protein
LCSAHFLTLTDDPQMSDDVVVIGIGIGISYGHRRPRVPGVRVVSDAGDLGGIRDAWAGDTPTTPGQGDPPVQARRHAIQETCSMEQSACTDRRHHPAPSGSRRHSPLPERGDADRLWSRAVIRGGGRGTERRRRRDRRNQSQAVWLTPRV